MNPKYTIAFITLCIILNAHSSHAGWGESKEIISESFGTADNQVGLTPSDTPPDSFPEGFWILGNKIVIHDTENRRIKIYGTDGILEKIVNWIKQPNGSFKIPEYPLAGTFVGYADGNLITYYSPQKDYGFYAVTGQIIKTTTTKPVELGTIREIPGTKNAHKISVTYPDRTYILDSDSKYEIYVRDFKKNIYAIHSESVLRFNRSGKKCAELLIPKTEVEYMPIKGQKFKRIAVNTEYGDPLLALNGDVYRWKKTPFRYSIIKWTWVDGRDAATGSCKDNDRTGK